MGIKLLLTNGIKEIQIECIESTTYQNLQNLIYDKFNIEIIKQRLYVNKTEIKAQPKDTLAKIGIYDGDIIVVAEAKYNKNEFELTITNGIKEILIACSESTTYIELQNLIFDKFKVEKNKQKLYVDKTEIIAQPKDTLVKIGITDGDKIIVAQIKY
jgi:hypothetical protein